MPEEVSVLKTVEIVSWSSSPGEVYSIGAFSPDAKMIAFTSTKAGTRNVWIKQTNSGESIQVTKDDFKNEKPIWSPTGEELAFFSTRGNQAGIWRTPVFGGSCKPTHWGPSASNTALQVGVRCFDYAGVPADEPFSVVYANPGSTPPPRFAYVLADQPTAASYTPAPAYHRASGHPKRPRPDQAR